MTKDHMRKILLLFILPLALSASPSLTVESNILSKGLRMEISGETLVLDIALSDSRVKILSFSFHFVTNSLFFSYDRLGFGSETLLGDFSKYRFFSVQKHDWSFHFLSPVFDALSPLAIGIDYRQSRYEVKFFAWYHPRRTREEKIKMQERLAMKDIHAGQLVRLSLSSRFADSILELGHSREKPLIALLSTNIGLGAFRFNITLGELSYPVSLDFCLSHQSPPWTGSSVLTRSWGPAPIFGGEAQPCKIEAQHSLRFLNSKGVGCELSLQDRFEFSSSSVLSKKRRYIFQMERKPYRFVLGCLIKRAATTTLDSWYANLTLRDLKAGYDRNGWKVELTRQFFCHHGVWELVVVQTEKKRKSVRLSFTTVLETAPQIQE